jgi:hypothetical protein
MIYRLFLFLFFACSFSLTLPVADASSDNKTINEGNNQTSSIPVIGTPLDLDTITQIVTIFVIADSLLSFVIAQSMERKALWIWRRKIWIILILIWISVFLPLIELIISTPPVKMNDFANPLTKIAIITWSIGVLYLLRIVHRVFTLDVIKFNKAAIAGTHPQSLFLRPTKWGLNAINKVFVREGTKDNEIYFPIIIDADEYCRPWIILHRFIISGLSYRYKYGSAEYIEPGAIIFAFTRRASDIFTAIEDTWKKLLAEPRCFLDGVIGGAPINWKNLVIIDCYSSFVKRYDDYTGYRKKSKSLPFSLIRADPNNPHDVNQKYEQAVIFLKEKGCKNIRVGYDTLSDFLKFTDETIAIQYLRHNMGWEEINKIESLYIFRSGTIDEKLEAFILWFANGVLKMEREESNHKYIINCDFRGPFKSAKHFKLDFDYNMIAED